MHRLGAPLQVQRPCTQGASRQVCSAWLSQLSRGADSLRRGLPSQCLMTVHCSSAPALGPADGLGGCLLRRRDAGEWVCGAAAHLTQAWSRARRPAAWAPGPRRAPGAKRRCMRKGSADPAHALSFGIGWGCSASMILPAPSWGDLGRDVMPGESLKLAGVQHCQCAWQSLVLMHFAYPRSQGIVISS